MTSGVMYKKNVSAKIAGRVGKAGSGSHPTFYQNTMEKKIILI